MKMNDIKNKRLLSKMLTNAILLRKNYQIPYVLYNAIMRLSLKDTPEVINILKEITEDYMRVRGYYKRKDREELANKELNLILNKK